MTDQSPAEQALAARVATICLRRVHRINRMQKAGLLTEAQADSLLDELDTPGSPAWIAHERYRQYVTARLRENGGMA